MIFNFVVKSKINKVIKQNKATIKMTENCAPKYSKGKWHSKTVELAF